MNKFIFYTSLILIFLLAGCSPPPPPTYSPYSTVLEGTWKKECHLNSDEDGYDIETNVYLGSKVTSTTDSYSDSDCTSKIIIFELTGTFQIGGSTTTTDTKTATQFDATISAITVTPLTEGIAGFLNSNEYCGATDWAINVGKDVFGCSTFELGNVTAGTIFKDIFVIDETTLTLGNDDNVGSEGYPTLLESIVYTKQ